MELYEIEWVQATSDLTILSALSIILFLVFFLPFLYLWIKNTRRHHRRCWIFPVQNVYRSVNKLRRGQRDVITRQSQIHVTQQGNVGLRIPPHN